MPNSNSRIARENKTAEAMIALYCHSHHNSDNLCFDCRELLVYTLKCLEKCPFHEGKTTCAKCPVHCYKPIMRERIKAVMRYAGPHMTYRHPILVILHLIDSLRKKPVTSV
ncbi:nitrous oxide-stimulated promoter family protein [Chloroflexota bacterium]